MLEILKVETTLSTLCPPFGIYYIAFQPFITILIDVAPPLFETFRHPTQPADRCGKLCHHGHKFSKVRVIVNIKATAMQIFSPRALQ